MKFINEILYDKKVNDIDCTEDESAYIKGWLRDTIIKPEDGSQQVLEDIQLHFPLEYSEYLGEIEEPLHESLTRSAKIGIAGFNEDGRVVSVTMQEQQSNSVVSIEDAADQFSKRLIKIDFEVWDKENGNDNVSIESIFEAGAKFRDEQYNSLLNSYRELLQCIEEIKGECDGHGVINQTWLLNKCQSALNNGDNILSQFKQ